MELPQHVAVIMDGNGRWARAKGLDRTEGHRAGADVVDALVTRCRELGIPYLTLYTFSRENWNRPKTEVSFLFDLLTSFLSRMTPKMVRNDIRLNLYGDMATLPLPARLALQTSMRLTAGCSALTLNLALNYSGRSELARAVSTLLSTMHPGAEVTEQAISDALYSAGQPDPDLVIRTGGEYRLSNFLPYQTVYSELYFTDTLWPEFTMTEFDRALDWFACRERRFGRTSEQIRPARGTDA